MNIKPDVDLMSKAFGLPADIQPDVFGSGNINDTYKIKHADQEWIVQRINQSVFAKPESVMNNIMLTAEFLSKTTYPLQILKPVLTLSGQPFYRDSTGACWRIFPFIKNAITYNEVADIRMAYKAARAFGDFVAGLSGFETAQLSETIPFFHDGNIRWADFEMAVNADKANRKKEIPDILDWVEAHKAFSYLIQYHRKGGVLKINTSTGEALPVRTVHHDTKINNVVFDSTTGEAVCVIDLDTLMPGTILSDFGDMVRTFVPNRDENETDHTRIKVRMEYFKAVVQGYMRSARHFLTPAEIYHLYEGGVYITFMQVIRFLGDYLNGDTYYKTAYSTQNLDRSRNQLALLRDIMRHEKDMRRVVLQESRTVT